MPKDSLKGLIQNEEKGAPGMGLREIADSLERKGRLEGKREGIEEVAKKLIDMGSDTSYIVKLTDIVKLTEFTPDEVEKLRQSSP
jgi:hypothetical protein